jgi:hypothetical protein
MYFYKRQDEHRGSQREPFTLSFSSSSVIVFSSIGNWEEKAREGMGGGKYDLYI